MDRKESGRWQLVRAEPHPRDIGYAATPSERCENSAYNQCCVSQIHQLAAHSTTLHHSGSDSVFIHSNVCKWALFTVRIVAKGFPFATNFGRNEISGLAVAKGCSKTSE
ncbi:hypothetical protein [Sphingomonas aerolata]|uniref:hypothetical protein n=1 Tax=Sphingomonas aerolata TaxID=185951 RepID=UPI00334A7AF6